MSVVLRQLSVDDGMDVYEMLQEIPEIENGFTNGCNGRAFEDFKSWLVKSDNTHKGIGLKDWMVPQTIYWLYVDGIPAGIAKLRHDLTDKLREEGGHIGYAIRPSYRNKGYGKLLLKLVIEEARKLGIEKMLITIRNNNAPSLKVALANGGVIEKINDERHYVWIDSSYSSEYEKIVFEVIYKRRSVRNYLDKAVEHEKIEKLLKAAMAAPSACNIQPWEFVVVADRGKIQDIKDSIQQYSQYNTPLIIVVCGNTEFIPWENDTGIIDCSAAIENMLLAATAMGLGSVWIGGFESDSIRQLLDIPGNVYPIGVVYFGYPADHLAPRTQYREEVIHWEKYDPTRKHEKAPGSIV